MTNENSLVQTEQMEKGVELHTASASSYAMQEIQGAMILAKKFPRDYKVAYGRLMMACKRKSLAVKAEWSYPRGGKNLSGPSVNLARVEAQCYENIRWGLDIIYDDDTNRHIRAWAWDIEMNIKVTADDFFKKLIYRKKDGWITPDERDLRELTNRRGAILVRNCLLQAMPRDFTDDAIIKCRETIASGIDDPRAAAKELIEQFGDLGVTVKMLNDYLGHDQWDKNDIINLTAVYNTLQSGEAKREEYFFMSPTGADTANTGIPADAAKPGDKASHQSVAGTLPLGDDKSKGGKK